MSQKQIPIDPGGVAVRPAPAARSQRLVALVGNPNTGKTTLFNQLTGARARVGNYPGVTVERRIGSMAVPGDAPLELMDLPGTYSLSARSPEEQIAIEAVLGLNGGPAPALAVVVVDAGQLVRNLYLVLQLIELEVPVVVAVNMIDEVERAPDTEALAALFGVPFVPIVARKGTGLQALREAIAAGVTEPPMGRVDVPYPAELLQDAERVRAALPEAWRATPGRETALALWALGSIDEDDELLRIDPELRSACLDLHRANGRDRDAELITARYTYLDQKVGPIVSVDHAEAAKARVRQRTERVDRVLLHPVWGFAVFIALMLVLFQALFTWADPAIGAIEDAFGWVGDLLHTTLPEGVVSDLLVEGVIGGAGNVIVFLPQILLLFLFIGLLEDSGYMARAAYLMDRVMKALGLHGRAFVPMLSGCACAIPAIMATRTMERERDRLLTMLVIPLMSCSARLPVYTLIIAALFPPSNVFGFVPVQGLLLVMMYVLSTLMALAAAGVLGRTVVRGRRMPLLIELPPYRLPTLRSVLRQMVERAGLFLKEAGTIILAATVVLWALLTFPRAEDEPQPQVTAAAEVQATAGAEDAEVSEAEEDLRQARQLQQSYAGRIGKAIEPAIEPLGFDWKIGVGLIGAFAAREVFVSTMGLVYGIGEADEESQPLRDKIRAEVKPDGTPIYTPLTGLSLMVFFMLACQCMSTLAVLRRETRSWKWPAFLFAYMTTLAWVASLLVYQGGKLLGFS